MEMFGTTMRQNMLIAHCAARNTLKSRSRNRGSTHEISSDQIGGAYGTSVPDRLGHEAFSCSGSPQDVNGF